jgi:hypothetical protein
MGQTPRGQREIDSIFRVILGDQARNFSLIAPAAAKKKASCRLD